MNFSKIKRLREENNLTQAQFAEAIGVTEKTVRNWERDSAAPSQTALSEIAQKFFHGNLKSLYDYFEGEKWDFADEDNLLATALENGTIPPIFASILTPLFDHSNQDAVGIALCSVLGGYRARPPAPDCFLGELASYVLNATSFNAGAEAGILNHDLMSYLLHCQSHSKNPQEVGEIIKALQDARCSNIVTERVKALQRCFFYLYDNIRSLADQPSYYNALSDIVIPLAGVDYGEKERKHLFFTLYQCAITLCRSHLKEGMEK